MTDLHREYGELKNLLRELVLNEEPSLCPEAVHGAACLSNELGLDSLRLASLFTAIRTRVGEVNLVPWFLKASRAGQDTLDNLAAHLAFALPRPVWPPPASPLTLGPGVGRAAWRASTPAAGTPVEAPFTSVAQALIERTRQDPSAIAYVTIDPDGTQRLIRRVDLLAAARGVAASLRRRGVGRGEAVIVCAETSPSLLALFWGCILNGVVPALLEPPVALARVAGWQRRAGHLIETAHARLLIVDEEIHAPACEVAVATGISALRVEELVPVSGDDRVGDRPNGDGRAQGGEALPGGDELAFLQFTSGTTARPRAVMISHANVLANARAFFAAAQLASDDLCTGWLPLHHDMGLFGTVLAPLLAGVPSVLMRPLMFLAAPAQWLWAFHHFRATFAPGPNFAFELCVRRIAEEELRGLDLASWRIAFNGSEPVTAATVARFFDRFAPHGLRAETMRPCYGMAECTLVVSVSRPAPPRIARFARLPLAEAGIAEPSDDAQALALVSVGPLVDGFEVRIVDDTGAALPERRQGEIQLRGPSVARGYLGDDAAHVETFAGGWLRTGDLGFLDRGELFVTGRRKDLIIRGGKKYAPYDLEHAAAAVDGVRAGCVAALGLADEAQGTEEVIVVFETSVAEAERWPALEKAVIARVYDEVGLRPERAVAVPPRTLPKTSSGKLMRPWIRARAAERAFTGGRR